MKRGITIFLGIALLGLFFLPHSALAQDLGQGLVVNTANKAGFDPATETTFAETLGQVVQIALSFVGIIFIGLTVYAGYLWMVARGDETLIDKSKSIIRASIIGLIITVGAYGIAAFVVPRIISGTTSEDDFNSTLFDEPATLLTPQN